MKNIILITFLFFMYACGYTSIYKNLKGHDFNIIITEMQGDRNMNNLIKNELNLYSNKDSETIFNVEIETEFEKLVLTKDTAGIITDYELSTNSTFIIYFDEKSKQVTFSENMNIKKQSDTFDEDLYEMNIKRNFASSLREKLISEIITIKYGDGIIIQNDN